MLGLMQDLDNQLNHQPPLPTGTIVVSPKGGFVAGGTTSLVERLPSGDIIKTPWAGDIREDDCRREIAMENQIYQRLGEDALLVKLKGWNSDTHTLTLEYMSNSTLEEYIRSHLKEISLAQKLRYVVQAVNALHLLHSAGVIHCDVRPHNLLLDEDLCLKIADFSGSSLDGSPTMVCPGPRYAAPDTIIGVVDFEWSYIGPVQLFGSAPWWLHMSRPTNQQWDCDEDDSTKIGVRYFKYFEIFKRVLEEEDGRTGCEDRELSKLVHWSEQSGAMWVHMLLTSGFNHPDSFPFSKLILHVGTTEWERREKEVSENEVEAFSAQKMLQLKKYEDELEKIMADTAPIPEDKMREDVEHGDAGIGDSLRNFLSGILIRHNEQVQVEVIEKKFVIG